jgi:hypothetical protein
MIIRERKVKDIIRYTFKISTAPKAGPLPLIVKRRLPVFASSETKETSSDGFKGVK